MLKDSLLFDLLLTALATLPATGFVGFLAAYCKHYGLPQPLRVDVVSSSGELMSGPPKELWGMCNPKERLKLIIAIDDSLRAIKLKRTN